MTKHNPDSHTCPGQVDTIHRYLDGELSPIERESFDIHVQQCRTCRTHLAGLAALFTEIDSLEEVAAPHIVVDRVMAGLPAAAPAPQVPLESARPRDTVSWLVLAGQTVLGLGLLLFILPFIRSVFSNQLLWSPWINLTDMFHSLSNWLSLLSIDFGNRVQAWPETMEFTRLDLSPVVASAIVVGLGLAWLIGNTMLLSSRQPISKNGGV